MDATDGHMSEDAPPSHTEVPVRVDNHDIPLVSGPDGHPMLASEADVVAQIVELQPDAELSADARRDLKDPEVRDIGWNKDMAHLPPTIVNGLSNEDLFLLVRRFNKQVYHVKAIPFPPPGQLDLEISENEEFSPDKLRAHLERLYITVIVGFAAFWKHIARIRSWNEPRRTGSFCIAYFAAWWSNLLGALICMTLLVLVLNPPSRHWLFPPAPLAAVSSKSGNLQVPRAGTIGSHDSLSGAPESHKGEAVEQEATNFVAGVGSLAVATATGQKAMPSSVQGDDADKDEQDESGVGATVPDPAQLVANTADAKHVAHGARTDGKHDPTRKHVEGAMWEKAKPVMRALADLADTWERLGNVLSPTAPFSQAPRLRLAALVLPTMAVLTVVPAALFVKGATFGLGFVIFGQPLIAQGIHWLNTTYPNWPEMIQLRRSLLKGVPTNAQLTITLLRIAEVSKTPLPPPPSSSKAVDEPDVYPEEAEAEVAEHAEKHLEFDTSNYEIEGMDRVRNADEHVDDHNDQHKSGGKLTKLLKGSAKATVSSAISVDHLKARLGSNVAKRRLGAIPDQSIHDVMAVDGPTGSRLGLGDGPTTYAARYEGKRGFVVLVTSAATPFVSFVREKDLNKNLASYANVVKQKMAGRSREPEAPQAMFAIPIADMQGLRKVGGYGWKGKMIIGYVLQREVVDGLGIEDKDGKTHYLTAIKGRDELFNRLIAVGQHRWGQL